MKLTRCFAAFAVTFALLSFAPRATAQSIPGSFSAASYPPPMPTCNPSNPNCCKTIGLCRR